MSPGYADFQANAATVELLYGVQGLCTASLKTVYIRAAWPVHVPEHNSCIASESAVLLPHVGERLNVVVPQ